MKILIDAHKIGEKHEGTSTHLIGLYRALMVIKPDWTFVFVGPYLEAMQEAFGTGENCRYLHLSTTNKFRRLLWDLPQIMRLEAADYAHFQYISPLWSPTPTLVTIHDLLFLEPEFKHHFPWTYRWLNGLLFRLSAQKAKILCSVSAYGQNQLSLRYGIEAQNIVITSNAVSTQLTSIEKAKKRVAGYDLDRFILFVSRVEPRKNHKALWSAFETLALHKQGFKLVFIGKKEWMDPDLETVMQQSDPSMQEAVIWLDSVPHEDLWAFYRAAALFVYPSLGEGFGIPPLEAAVVGTPVVCARNTAMVDFDFLPYLVDVNQPEALENAINKALKDTDYPAQQIAAAIQNKYNWSASAKALIQAIEQNNSKSTAHEAL
ncbi:MAG: hypothetical protein RIQ82_678 [Bacteroidota bacterium]